MALKSYTVGDVISACLALGFLITLVYGLWRGIKNKGVKRAIFALISWLVVLLGCIGAAIDVKYELSAGFTAWLWFYVIPITFIIALISTFVLVFKKN